jgi:predicted ATP-dependent protease
MREREREREEERGREREEERGREREEERGRERDTLCKITYARACEYKVQMPLDTYNTQLIMYLNIMTTSILIMLVFTYTRMNGTNAYVKSYKGLN